jgi:hypothetical protein
MRHYISSLIKMCFGETYSEVRIGKYSIYRIHFLFKVSRTRRCFIVIAFQLCFRVCH